MKYIAHRGNINGPNINEENKPEYIKKALELGYDVEIDIWYIENILYTGHGKGQYEIDLNFLKNKKLWCHAKNIDALNYLIKNKIHCFWHQNDEYTITTEKYIWTYPGKEMTENSIVVMPELSKKKINKNISGICSDYIKKYKII